MNCLFFFHKNYTLFPQIIWRIKKSFLVLQCVTTVAQTFFDIMAIIIGLVIQNSRRLIYRTSPLFLFTSKQKTIWETLS